MEEKIDSRCMDTKYIKLGNADVMNRGVADCVVYVAVTVKDGALSMVGYVTDTTKRWKGRECAAQIWPSLLSWFPNDKRVKEVVKIWRRWHLNGLHAGTGAQQYLVHRWIHNHGERYSYELIVKYLKRMHAYDDGGYIYGHEWLSERLPDCVMTEVESWK